MKRASLLLCLALPAAVPSLMRASQGTHGRDLSLPDAVRAAWLCNPGLQAGQAAVDAARLQAGSAASLRLPALTAQAGWIRTDEPMMAFGMKLNQARIQAADFNPASLNHPEPVHGLGGSLVLQQPLYAGGRIDAARRAADAMASAEAAQQARRKQEMAASVVKAYFGLQAATASIAYAEETVKTAQAAEAFVSARVEQGMMFKADLARVKAWRAQAEAQLAESRRQEASLRSGLSLLIGGTPFERLSTPLETAAAPAGSAGVRGDLEASRLQAEVAQTQARIMAGSLKPEVGLSLGLGTARETSGGTGGNWTTASIGVKWTFSFSDARRAQAARASARAAEFALSWRKAQADREVDESRNAITAAESKVKAAEEAVQAATEARDLRQARHREGLLPLTELLDAESALAGARALRLGSLLDLRAARAESALALGTPVEGVSE